nr:LOW QUALITY PROTEIN: carcinoembryonic antigen-related cell adhesion molecule 1-like [Equus asinus]
MTWQSTPAQEEAQDRGRKHSRADTWWAAVLPSFSGAQALLTEGGTEQAAATMQSLSAPAHRGYVPWKGLLLAVSLLSFWNLPTTAQITVESLPPNAAEGQNVILVVQNLPRNLLGYNWFKGDRPSPKTEIAHYDIDRKTLIPGLAFTGRETICPYGSLLLANVTMEYAGNYTVFVIKRRLQYEVAIAQLHVHKPVPKPSTGIVKRRKHSRYIT